MTTENEVEDSGKWPSAQTKILNLMMTIFKRGKIHKERRDFFKILRKGQMLTLTLMKENPHVSQFSGH